MRVISIIASKGGVAKTTLSCHLAVEAAGEGGSLVVDLDPQSSAMKWHSRRSDETVRVQTMPASRMVPAIAVAGMSAVIIDTPPRASREALEASKIAGLVLIPTSPSILDLDALEATADMLERQGVDDRAAFVLTQVPTGHRPAGSTWPAIALEAEKALRDAFPRIRVCPCVVSRRVAFERAMRDGRAVREYQPAGKAAMEIADLWWWIKETIDG
jgi:chromosome partitioning protein